MTYLVRLALLSLLALATAVQAQELIRLGNLKFAHYGAVSYIKEIAPKCGIRVEEVMFAKGPDIMQAILAGELDVGATASEAAISGRANGAPIFVVAGFAKGGVRLLARTDSHINTVKDLKGKRVGVTRGAIHEVLLVAELARHGLTASDLPGKDVELVYLSFSDLNQALLGKHVDAIIQSEPHASQAINKGYAVEINKPYDTPIGAPIRTMVMSEKFYAGRREQAAKFMQCFVQATKLFIDNKALAEKYVRETMFKNQISKDDYVDAIDNSPFTYDISAAHIQVTTDLMAKYGTGKMRKAPLAAEWVRTDLLDLAKKSLSIQ